MKVSIRLVGSVHVSVDGLDLTPKSARGRAILAILCLSPDFTRTRRKIEALLWSDRAEAQARDSHRTELAKLRRTFANAPAFLSIDPEKLALDRDAVWIDLFDDPDAAAGRLEKGLELCEGLGIRSPDFEDWLRDERLSIDRSVAKSVEHAVAKPATPLILLETASYAEDDVQGRFLAELLGLSIEQQIRDFSEIAVQSLGGESLGGERLVVPHSGTAIRINVKAFVHGDENATVLVEIMNAKTGHRLHNLRRRVPVAGTDLFNTEMADALAHEATHVALELIVNRKSGDRDRRLADNLLIQASQHMLCPSPDGLMAASRLLAEAHEARPDGRALAWMSMLQMIMRNERLDQSALKNDDEIEWLRRRAMELAPHNALVRALLSLSESFGVANPGAARVNAEAARRLDPSNPFAAMAWTVVSLYEQAPATAVTLAQRARNMASGSLYLHWWESTLALTQLATGDAASALSNFEAAHVRAPDFNSVQRHLFALYHHFGQHDHAERIERLLRAREPDFSMDRMREDGAYPASTLRRMGLLNGPTRQI